MAKSVFRRFPSDDIDLDPMVEESDIGQSLIRTAVGSVGHLVLDDFWEFVQGGGGPVPLAAVISGVFVDSATMAVVRGVQAALAGQLTASASLQAARQMAALVANVSTATGALQVARALEAAVSGALLTAVGQFHVDRVLAALYNIASGMSASMAVERGLVDPMEAALTSSASLSVSGAEAPSAAVDSAGGPGPWYRGRSPRQQMAFDAMISGRSQQLRRKHEQDEQRMEALERANIVNESRKRLQ
jgi:hypothetical protein